LSQRDPETNLGMLIEINALCRTLLKALINANIGRTL
jgi:hypothetical protein